MTASAGGVRGGETEQQAKGLVDMDNNVVAAGGRGVYIRDLTKWYWKKNQ